MSRRVLAAVIFFLLLVSGGCKRRTAPEAAQADMLGDNTASKAQAIDWSKMPASPGETGGSKCGSGGAALFITAPAAGEGKKDGPKTLPDAVAAEKPSSPPVEAGQALQAEEAGCRDSSEEGNAGGKGKKR